MVKTLYTIRYRKGSKGGKTPLSAEMLYNPSSFDEAEMIRRAELMWKNRESSNVLAASVVRYVEEETVWHGGDV